MPYLSLRSNAPSTGLAGLGPKLSTALAELLGKSEQYVMIDLRGDQAMWFGGSDKPCAMVEVKSIGLTEAQAKSCARELCAQVAAHTAIPADRVYVQFADIPRTMWGWDGRTFG